MAIGLASVTWLVFVTMLILHLSTMALVILVVSATGVAIYVHRL